MKISLIAVAAAVTLLFYANKVSTQIINPGVCPNYPVVQNFSMDLFRGVWYLIEDTVLIKDSCVQYTFVCLRNGYIRVEKTSSDTSADTDLLIVFESILTPEYANSTEAKFLITDFVDSPPARYWILDSDYSSYSIILLCGTQNQNFQSLMFLSRVKIPSQPIKDHVHGFLSDIGFDLTKLTETSQTSCEA